ncbi:MAG: hypothetical protein EPO09_21060 [Aquabacterium sp.]|uniref:hypothetical protein n=1 Tax=Aquabacterium sp. TaxID=1872578 RepID=UPI00121E4D84|nr:hypothetical protein [Aquabacterium sp.]TAK84225.1 MAG: hypothetical protein EPO09_21060 [Aquabacterium sp.]
MRKLVLPILLSAIGQTTYAEPPHFKDHQALYTYVAKTEGYIEAFSELDQPKSNVDITSIQPALPTTIWGKASIKEDGVIIGSKRYAFLSAKDWPPSSATGPFKLDLQLTRVFLDQSGRRMCLQSSLGGNGGWARWRNIAVIEINAAGKPVIHKWSAMYASCNGIFFKDKQLVIGTLWHHHLSENDFTSMKLDLRNAWEGVLQARYELNLSTPGNAFDFVAFKK